MATKKQAKPAAPVTANSVMIKDQDFTTITELAAKLEISATFLLSRLIVDDWMELNILKLEHKAGGILGEVAQAEEDAAPKKAVKVVKKAKKTNK